MSNANNGARVSSQPTKTTGNVVRDSVLGLVPETVDPYLGLNYQVWHAGPLNPAELEMIRLRNARKVGCVFCKAVRYDVATNSGLFEEKISWIDDDFERSPLSDREKLILRFTDYYLQDPTEMMSEFKSEMAVEFSVEEISHMSIALMLFNTFSRCAVALGGMPEHELPLIPMEVPQ
ncbi:MAG: carboxymuconolactone decarboxylase family protein [Pseudomonadales bacterium]